MTQRLTIPLAWALAVASPSATLKSDGDTHYFATRVDDALVLLDRALASWNYNSYFRDTLAPVSIFRKWLANNAPDTWLYLNVSELIQRSPTPAQDLTDLRELSDKVEVAIAEIEKKDFTLFLRELRRLTTPFVTVPITGDRQRDIEMLTFEIRDTESVEEEMALQMIGVDRDQSLLREAADSIKMKRTVLEVPAGADGSALGNGGERQITLFTRELEKARSLFTDSLGCTVINETSDRVLLDARGVELMLLVNVSEAA